MRKSYFIRACESCARRVEKTLSIITCMHTRRGQVTMRSGGRGPRAESEGELNRARCTGAKKAKKGPQPN